MRQILVIENNRPKIYTVDDAEKTYSFSGVINVSPENFPQYKKENRIFTSDIPEGYVEVN